MRTVWGDLSFSSFYYTHWDLGIILNLSRAVPVINTYSVNKVVFILEELLRRSIVFYPIMVAHYKSEWSTHTPVQLKEAFKKRCNKYFSILFKCKTLMIVFVACYERKITWKEHISVMMIYRGNVSLKLNDSSDTIFDIKIICLLDCYFGS